MTPKQYRAALDRLGISIYRAGQLWATPRSSQRWANGQSPIPKAVIYLLGLLTNMPTTDAAIILAYSNPITDTDD